MKVFRVLTLLSALSFVGASMAVAQGPKAGHGRAPAPAAKAAPKGPKAPHSRPEAARSKPSRHAARAEEGGAIAARIARNPQLEARLKAMLPSGMTLEQAAEGFRNQGQFVAALEASKNHNIPFDQLKREMTGDNALSLGQAIQKLRPSEKTESE